MSFRDVFFTNENETKPNVKAETPKGATSFPSETKFPTNSQTFPTNNAFPSNGSVFSPNPTVAPVSNPFLDKIFDVYDKGFTKLNQPGYDFFEFFKAVSKGGIDNPQVYEMALEMGIAMDSNVSKQSLLNQADYYITELTKVHSGFSSDGQSKITDLTNKKNSETNSLVTEISSLKQQLESIQNQIRTKESSLAEIGDKYQPDINDIGYKLSANDMVKDKFVTNINKVKSNISNNLK